MSSSSLCAFCTCKRASHSVACPKCCEDLCRFHHCYCCCRCCWRCRWNLLQNALCLWDLFSSSSFVSSACDPCNTFHHFSSPASQRSFPPCRSCCKIKAIFRPLFAIYALSLRASSRTYYENTCGFGNLVMIGLEVSEGGSFGVHLMSQHSEIPKWAKSISFWP